MHRLIVLPGEFQRLGGTVISLSLLLDGIQRLGMESQLTVLLQENSVTHQYLQNKDLTECVELVSGDSRLACMRMAFEWIDRQPKHHALLLDNWADRNLMPLLMVEGLKQRLIQRPTYHFCHDLSISHNYLGYLLRKAAFACVAPTAICNSNFTASYIRPLIPTIGGVLYQPVDTERFQASLGPVPPGLEAIVASNAKILLTPSRINKPKIVNDKNLRALIPVLAELKQMDAHYHLVIIGPDTSSDGSHAQSLLDLAKRYGVEDCFTILPPAIDIERYFLFAEAVITLAPREPFGRTVVEAIASGTPVIGSNTGGIAEILNNFAPEWTVDPEDAPSVAKRIVSLLDTPEATQQTLQDGRYWISNHCQVTQYAKDLMLLTGMVIG